MMPALVEAYRVLKPGGVVVLTIPYPNLVHRLVQFRRKRDGVGSLSDEGFYESAYTRRQLVEIVSGAGFDVVLAKRLATPSHFWGLGDVFREPGYYRTSALADTLGGWLKRLLPWAFNFSTLIIARK